MFPWLLKKWFPNTDLHLALQTFYPHKRCGWFCDIKTSSPCASMSLTKHEHFFSGVLWWEDSCFCCCGRNFLLWIICCHLLAKKEVRLVIYLSSSFYSGENQQSLTFCFALSLIFNLVLFSRGKMPGLTFSNELISRDEVCKIKNDVDIISSII